MIGNIRYLEAVYEDWCRDPHSVEPAWRAFFEAEELEPSHLQPAATPLPAQEHKQSRVDSLLWAYRDIGYLYAKLNPLGGDHGPDHSYLHSPDAAAYEKLTPGDFGLSDADLDTPFFAGRAMQPSVAPLRDILAAFRRTYCSFIGVEFLHIQDKEKRRWLMHRMESSQNSPELDVESQRIILQDLIQTEELEKFLGTFFIGQKRFSLEGSEAVVPGLHALVDRAHSHGIEEIVIGATHRGRLSILKSVLNMSPAEIFADFRETHNPVAPGGSGDVKYHIGYDTDHRNEDGTSVHLSLVANPSHLESVFPVVEGKTRGLQDKAGDTEHKRIVPVILHGDAAFCGQGVVPEALNLSQLNGYGTGGTIHIIINNQIGFTTSARSGRSTVFPTDIAKGLQTPVLHVNGDRPESLVHAVELGLDYRQTFGADIVIDLFCFRRHGHNEGDDPSFTQPLMYRLVEKHPGVARAYGQRCAEDGVMSEEQQEEVRRTEHAALRAALEHEQDGHVSSVDLSQGPEWEALSLEYSWEPAETAAPEDTLRSILDTLSATPDDFHVHPKLARINATRLKKVQQNGTVDWALAESLAFGSLLIEGIPVRLSGEDSARGTFSQRHLTWWDVQAEEPTPLIPLNTLETGQALLQAVDSPLSEYAILGFEYGYSLVQPMSLVLWEAQFGDFANGAEVVIDEFIASAEGRWGRRSGLVLLLPHGYEGQGPDHSSAHLERYLQLCAENNIQVCNATTPAQYFHLLRRQMKRPFRKPLVIMTPKSLLRHPQAVSPLSDLSRGTFAEVVDDPQPPQDVRRLVLCSGKIYYDLHARRETLPTSDTALVRLEQLYPFPVKALRELVHRYPACEQIVWTQEEHKNYSAWSFVLGRMSEAFPDIPLQLIGRPERASKAAGTLKQHRLEQETLLDEVFPAPEKTAK